MKRIKDEILALVKVLYVFSLQFIFRGQWFQGALILGRNKWNFGPKVWAPKLAFHPQRLFWGHCHLLRQWQSLTAPSVQRVPHCSRPISQAVLLTGITPRSMDPTGGLQLDFKCFLLTKNLPSDAGPLDAGGIRTWELGCGLRASVSSSTGTSVSTGVDRLGSSGAARC